MEVLKERKKSFGTFNISRYYGFKQKGGHKKGRRRGFRRVEAANPHRLHAISIIMADGDRSKLNNHKLR